MIATIDARRDIVHGRDARLALAQEHEARPRDARPDGLRAPSGSSSSSTGPTAASASPATTWRRSSAASPTCSSPSDREIPRAVNEGAADRQSPRATPRRPSRSARSPQIYRSEPRRLRRTARKSAANVGGRAALCGRGRRKWNFTSDSRRRDRSAPTSGRDPFAEVKNRDPHRGDRRSSARSSSTSRWIRPRCASG